MKLSSQQSPSPPGRHKEFKATEKKRAETQVKETGVVLRHSKDKTYGFIKPDRMSFQKDIFFHLRCLVDKGSFPDIGQRVWFYVVETSKGLEANPLWVRMEVRACLIIINSTLGYSIIVELRA